MIAQPLPQPTLPNVCLEDDDDASSMRTRGPAPSTFTGQSDYYYGDRKEYGLEYPPSDYPPMPAYNQQYGHGDPYFNPSVPTLHDEQAYDDNDYGSTANLALAAAPIAHPDIDRGHANSTPRPVQGGGYGQQQADYHAYAADPYAADPHAAYRGPSRGPSPGAQLAYGQAYSTDHGYDDVPQYNQRPNDMQQQQQQQYQQQHQQQQQHGYGYPEQHQQGRGGGNGYDYGSPGQAL